MLIHSAVITGSVQFNNTDVSGITNVSSFATTSSVDALVVKTGSFATTSSVNELQSKTGSYTSTSSFGAYSSSINTFTSSATTRLNTIESVTGSFASTSSVNNLQSVTGSFATTSSFTSYTSSNDGKVNAVIAKTGSFATTGSNAFTGSQTITGSLTATGTITAQTLVVQTITSSVEYSSGSNIFGSLSSNTHQFTGSVYVTGSLTVTNGIIVPNSKISIGVSTTTSGTDVVAIGYAPSATGNNTIAIGYNPKTEIQGQFGSNSNNSIAIGYNPYAGGNNSIAIGYTAKTNFANSINIGDAIFASGSNVWSTGSLGVGTSSPADKFQVNLASAKNVFARLGANNLPSIGFLNDAAGSYVAGEINSSALTITGATTFSSNVTISGGQTGGYVYASSGYVNETQTVSTNGTSYYLYKYTGTSNGSSTTTFNITGMSTTNGTYADIYAIAQKDATASGINTNVGVQINGQSMNLPTIQASGTGASTVRCTFRVCRMESVWVIIGNPNTSYF